jgi:5-methylthioribose kinase
MAVLGSGDGFQITEIGDGNLNFVFRVARSGHPERSVIVKQAVPYLRCAGEGWPLGRDRMIFEIRAAQAYSHFAPGFVPEVYHADEEMSVIIMEDLRDLRVLRNLMIEGEILPNIGRDIGEFLGSSLFKSSYLGMSSIDRRELMHKFNMNAELCKLTEEFIFTFPFVGHESNYVNPETNAYAMEVFRRDPEYLFRILHYKEMFLSKPDALLHGDLHTGSLMAGPDSTYVIDSEFAFFGPFGFDVGKIIANFLMCYTAHFHRPGGSSYQAWLLGECKTIWDTFSSTFETLWDGHPGSSALLFKDMLVEADFKRYKADFMRRILREAIGFCACSIARRTVGIAGVADIRGIEDPGIRTRLEKMNIDLSHFLLMGRDDFRNIDHFISLTADFYAQHQANQ